jgi:hypothetical protein
MKSLLIAGLLIAVPGLAIAKSPASELASLLGSDEACGLTFDQAAVQKYIDDYVDPSDIGYSERLGTFIGMTRRDFRDVSKDEKTIRCYLIRRTAKHYGFIN